MKILIVGAQGRMGLEIRKIIKNTKGLIFVGGIGRKKEKKIVPSFLDVKEKPQLVIDFSSPEMFRQSLDWCLQERVPFLSGTTGLTPKDFKTIKAAAKKIPVLWTANTSVGVQMVKDILKNMPLPLDYKVQLTEWHHIHKKDKPSGTAIVLQNILKLKRQNLPAPRSVREGEIVGTHRIELISKEEVITIEHKALKRAVFARGAVQVGRWLCRQRPGLYQMEDYLRSL
jgi:4-hydroxy-tetrahydrodipicolinate reductase